MKKLLAFILCAIGQGAYSADIVYQWDDVMLAGEKQYHILYSIDNVEQPIVDIAGTETSYRLTDVGVGTYVAQIAVSEDGNRGDWSPSVTLTVTEIPAKPERMTFTVSFECDNCNLEAK